MLAWPCCPNRLADKQSSMSKIAQLTAPVRVSKSFVAERFPFGTFGSPLSKLPVSFRMRSLRKISARTLIADRERPEASLLNRAQRSKAFETLSRIFVVETH